MGSTPTFGTNFINMKITFEDKLHGTSTWEAGHEGFEICEVLQAVKGLLVSHGYHEWVVNEEFVRIAQDIKDEYHEEDTSEVIDPVQGRYIDPVNQQTWNEQWRNDHDKLTTMEKLIAEKDDNLLKWPNDFDGVHSTKE